MPLQVNICFFFLGVNVLDIAVRLTQQNQTIKADNHRLTKSIGFWNIYIAACA